MKSYSDLEQSKKLAEILPLESADMCYKCIEDDPYDIVCKPYSEWKEEYKGLLIRNDAKVIPCWSFAALFDALPDGTDIVKEEADTENEKYMCTVGVKDDIISTFGNNPVDACVLMIEKLYELKML